MKRSPGVAEPASQPDTLGARGLAPKQVIWFLAKSLAFYVLLLLAWPVVGDAYGAFLRTGGNLLLGNWGPRGKAEFRLPPSATEQWDMVSVLTNRERGTSGQASHSSHLVGYLPTATLVALVLASPFPWRRRLRALIWGLLLVNLFVAFRMGLGLLADFCSKEPYALYVLHPWAKRLLNQAVFVFLYAPAAYFVGPACIWILVTFRRSDWELLFGGSRKGSRVVGQEGGRIMPA